MLTEEACWPTKLARTIANADAIELGEVKFTVSKALRALQKDGRIGRERMQMGDDEVVLYYRRDNAMFGLHRFMERKVTKKLEQNGIAYELAKPGENKPDIMTTDFDIEIETELKHDIKELERKLAKTTKKTYIVVPNEGGRERYMDFVKHRNFTMILLNEVTERFINK